MNEFFSKFTTFTGWTSLVAAVVVVSAAFFAFRTFREIARSQATLKNITSEFVIHSRNDGFSSPSLQIRSNSEEVLLRLERIEESQKEVLYRTMNSFHQFDRMARELRIEVSSIKKSSVVNLYNDNLIASIGDFPTQLPLSREMSHALKTPLSRIDASAELISLRSEGDFEQDIGRIKSATQVCNYFLDAFRAVSEEYPASDKRSGSFHVAATDAAALYVEMLNKDVKLSIGLPDKISAVPKYYALAVILPLLENAIEASEPHQTISVRGKEEDGLLTIRLSNSFLGIFPGDKIYETGFSTKSDDSKRGNEGLGMGIVKNFLAGLSVGNISYRLSGHQRVTFTVKMRAQSK